MFFEKRMISRKLLTIVIFLVMGISTLQGLAGQPPVAPDSIEQNGTTFSVTDFNEEYAILTFTTDDLIDTTVVTEEGTFTLLTIPDMGYIMEVGQPQLPCTSRLVAVPNTQVSSEILHQEYYDINVGPIYPAQAPEPDSYSIDTEFVMDYETYSADGIYPGEVVSVEETGMIRIVPFAKIRFYPVQYSPSSGSARVYTVVQVKLSWDNSEEFQVQDRHKSKYFDEFYESSFVNWEQFKDIYPSVLNTDQNNIRASLGCEYLIITDAAFYNAASALRDWKNERGIDTWLFNTSVVGSTSAELELYLQNVYDNWIPAPSFILFVGDAEFIPTTYYNIHPYHGTLTGTDLWYMTVSGSDHYPDYFYGRIPVDTVFDANNYIQKIIDYEIDPPYHSGYYMNMTVAAYFQDDENNGYETRRFVRTSEEVRDFLHFNPFAGSIYNVTRIYVTPSSRDPRWYNDGSYGWPAPGAPIPAELLRANGYPWDGDADDIKNRVDSGTLILNHRDHGLRNGWGDPHYQIPELALLDNGELLPVVFSINCETGWFDHETDGDGSTNTESFCEEFVRKVDGGTVCIFGATRVSYSGYNDFMCRGYYDAMWPDFDMAEGGAFPMYRMGQVLNSGKVYMATHSAWGDPWGYEELTFELFHVFGDPTMEIWTSEPIDLNVSHPNTIQVNSTQVQVDVVQNGALVCLVQGGEIIGTGYSAAGSALIDVNPVPLGTINVTVTKHNYRPYRGTIDVIDVIIPTPPWVNLTAPDGGEIWPGGSPQTILWDMGDEHDDITELTVDLYYSTDGGGSYPNPIATGLTGFAGNPCQYDWNPIPLIDSSSMKVKVDVIDTDFLTDTDESALTFTIDSTAPQPATNLHAELTGTNDVTIYWDLSVDDGGGLNDVVRYELWYVQNGWDPAGSTYGYLATIPAGTNNYVHLFRGADNQNSYCYQIRTFDIVDREAITLVQAAKYGRALALGANPSHWWLMGSALVQSSTSIDHVIQGTGLPSNYVMAWDAVNQKWISDMPARPDSLNGLTDITNEMGFWLEIHANTRLCTAGYIEDMSINCYAGWNLVPYPYAQRLKTTGEIDTDLITNCPNYVPGSLRIFDYNEDYGIKTPAGETISNNEEGFWVQVTADTVWTVTNY